MIPHQKTLIDAIKVRLGGILMSEGYTSDAGARVFEWRDPLVEAYGPNELPALWLRDSSKEITAIDSATHEHAIRLDAGAVDVGASSPDAIRSHEADLLKAFGVDPTFGGLCHYCQPTSANMDVKAGASRVSGTIISFEIRYRTPAFNPYELAADPT